MNFIIIVYIFLFFFGIYLLLLFVMLYFSYKRQLYDYPEPKKLPAISFITPAYNEEETIEGTLNSLLKLDYPKTKIEIIVVNDGSTDRTAEIVRGFVRKYKSVKLLNKENSGKANSLNQAVKIAKGELIAVVDADSHPTPSSFKKMVGFFEDQEVAAVTSKVWIKNKKNFIEHFQNIDYTVIAWSRKILDFIGCVYVTNGPLSVYRKSLVKEVGGFDPQNMTEDIEITWNFLSRGYKTKMCYDSEVYTVVPKTFKNWVNQRVRWNVGGMQTLYKYRKFFMKGENLFGYFVMLYVSASFVLSTIGFLLFLRFLYYEISPFLYSIPYILQGHNPFMFLKFYFPLTILLLFGIIFVILSVFYHKLALRESHLKKKGIFSILVYTFIYRPLYIIPLILSFYKIIRKDIKWYTK